MSGTGLTLPNFNRATSDSKLSVRDVPMIKVLALTLCYCNHWERSVTSLESTLNSGTWLTDVVLSSVSRFFASGAKSLWPLCYLHTLGWGMWIRLCLGFLVPRLFSDLFVSCPAADCFFIPLSFNSGSAEAVRSAVCEGPNLSQILAIIWSRDLTLKPNYQHRLLGWSSYANRTL